MSAEEWRPVPGFPGYEVSDLGRVRSVRSRWAVLEVPRLLNPWASKKGYRYVTLNSAEKATKRSVHSLVLGAFVGPRPDDAQDIRHLNGIKDDNRLENLAYGTRAENERDKIRHGGHYLANRTHCIYGHPFAGDNLRIRKNGQRICRTCVSARSAIAYAVLRGAPHVDLATYFAREGAA